MRVKYFVLALVAVFASALVAGTASANTVTAEPAGSITATSEGRLTFAGRGGIEIAINCRVTLGGSINRTINNAAGGAAGSITSGAANECNTGSATPLVSAGNPWPLVLTETARLEGATKLVGISVNNAQFQVNVAGQECLYSGNVATQLEGEGSPVVTRRIRVLANAENRSRGGFLCPARGELRGSFNVTTQTLIL